MRPIRLSVSAGSTTKPREARAGVGARGVTLGLSEAAGAGVRASARRGFLPKWARVYAVRHGEGTVRSLRACLHRARRQRFRHVTEGVQRTGIVAEIAEFSQSRGRTATYVTGAPKRVGEGRRHIVGHHIAECRHGHGIRTFIVILPYRIILLQCSTQTLLGGMRRMQEPAIGPLRASIQQAALRRIVVLWRGH